MEPRIDSPAMLGAGAYLAREAAATVQSMKLAQSVAAFQKSLNHADVPIAQQFATLGAFQAQAKQIPGAAGNEARALLADVSHDLLQPTLAANPFLANVPAAAAVRAGSLLHSYYDGLMKQILAERVEIAKAAIPPLSTSLSHLEQLFDQTAGHFPGAPRTFQLSDPNSPFRIAPAIDWTRLLADEDSPGWPAPQPTVDLWTAFGGSRPTMLTLLHLLNGGQIVNEARKYIGTPYQLGGESKAGVDCSSLVQLVLRGIGVNVPRTSESQWASSQGTKISSFDQLRPGDVVYFDIPEAHEFAPPDHVGIYAGNGQMIVARKTGTLVQYQSIADGYWRHAFYGAKRFA